MNNQNLLAIFRAFKVVFENLPSELPSEKYTPAVNQLKQGYSEILYPLLKTQYFAFCVDSDGECVSIFATEAERDSYIKTMRQIGKECRERGDVGEITCRPITFGEFLDFADAEELDLNNYSLDEDGAIEFVHSSNSVETTS